MTNAGLDVCLDRGLYMYNKPTTYMYTFTCTCMHVCLSGLWLGGLLYCSFLSVFLKLVCHAHVFPRDRINIKQMHTYPEQDSVL